MIPVNGYPYDKSLAKRYSMRSQANMNVSPHFRVYEFACHDGSDEVLIHPALPHLLEAIRTKAGGKAVTINSGYRTPSHNSSIGGASSSRHVSGQAADITIRGLRPSEVRRIAKAVNPGGLGSYASFTHVDVQGMNRRWGYR